MSPREVLIFALVILAVGSTSVAQKEELLIGPKPWYPIKQEKDFGCNICWERCLGFPGSYQWQYSYLKRLIDEARGLRVKNGASKGTAFILDSTASSWQQFNYQKMLSAIVAMTMPVEFDPKDKTKSCNPFFYAQYFEFGTWA